MVGEMMTALPESECPPEAIAANSSGGRLPDSGHSSLTCTNDAR